MSINVSKAKIIRMNLESNQVVGSGLIALDVVLKNEDTALYSALGGSTGNVLAILSHFGWDASPVAHISADNAGISIRREFNHLGSDTSFLVNNDVISGTPVIYQWPGDDAKTHHFSFACPKCGQKRRFSDYACSHTLALDATKKIHTPKVYYFDRVTPLSLELASIYSDRGTVIMFEPSELNVDEIDMKRAISLAHIIKYADDRIKGLANFDLSNVNVEIQTMGADGLRFRAPSLTLDWVDLEPINVPVIADTAGAGDWCSAGFLYYMFNVFDNPTSQIFSHNSISNSLKFGQALSSLNCMYEGARGLMRYRSPIYILRAAHALKKDRDCLEKSDRQVKGELNRMHHYFKEVINKKYIKNRFIKNPSLCCEPIEFMRFSK